MKKYFSILAIAAVVLASCAKEPVAPADPADNQTDLVALNFTGITDDGLSKTSLGNDFSIVWSTEDDITVFPGTDAAGVGFDVTATERDGHEATFSGTAAASEVYYALSPAQAGSSIAAGKISAELPAAQTAVAGSFGPDSNVSVAEASDYVFNFKNVGALVGVTPGNDGITAIRLEALGGEQISGAITVSPDGEIVSRDGGESYVQLSGSFASGSKYYFVVLPGIYSAGFRVTLFKGSQYTSFSKPASKAIGRNDNHDLGTFTGNKWKTAFTVGEGVKIKGSAEDGQDVAYVGSADYWNPSTQYSDVDGYAYNYEVFTRLTGGQKFYFEADGGEKFALNADGTAVDRILNVANAAYGAPSDGIYRIRLVMPDGAAEVKKISEVKYDIYGLDSRLLSYQGGGVWSSDNFLMRTDSYMNRYRFLVKFSDDSKQYYGRMRTSGGNPTYGVTEASYYYVQPSIDSSADHWSPCFQFQNTFEGNYTRFYCTMTLSLNNAAGHYTHSISNISDSYDTSSDVICIGASAEAGQEMVHIRSDYYNTAMAGFGDTSLLVADPIDSYDYEIFTRLTSGQKFYFYNLNTETFYAPSSDGTSVSSISSPADATYSISTDGVWRIRANFSTGKVNIRRIDQVRTELNYDNSADGAVHILSYDSRGTWKKTGSVIKFHPGQYGRATYSEYVVKLWFNRDNAGNTIDLWQVYGSTNQKSGSPDANDDGSYWNLQPYTGEGWNMVFFYPSWTIDAGNNGRYSATISLHMNNLYGHYTHRFTDVTAN